MSCNVADMNDCELISSRPVFYLNAHFWKSFERLAIYRLKGIRVL